MTYAKKLKGGKGHMKHITIGVVLAILALVFTYLWTAGMQGGDMTSAVKVLVIGGTVIPASFYFLWKKFVK